MHRDFIRSLRFLTPKSNEGEWFSVCGTQRKRKTKNCIQQIKVILFCPGYLSVNTTDDTTEEIVPIKTADNMVWIFQTLFLKMDI